MKESFRPGRFARIGAVVGIAGALATGVDANFVRPEHFKVPGKIQPLNPELASWKSLTALERIQKLETLQYPETESFDQTKELITAAAEFYCQSLDCNLDSNYLIKNTNVVSTQEFIKASEQDQQRSFTEEEKKRELESQEFVTRDKQKVYINIQRIKNYVKANEERMKPQLKGRDFEAIFLKSILFHAFSHVNISQKTLSTPGYSEYITDRDVNIERMEDFKFIGKRTSEDKDYFITGLNEAVADLISAYVGHLSGSHVTSDRYGGSADLLRKINKEIGVSDQEMIEIALGRSSIEDYLYKINPNSRIPAQKALFVVAMNWSEGISNSQAVDYIGRFMGRSLH